MAGELPGPHEADFLFYAGPDGTLHIEVFYAGETVWLTQKRMAELFDVDVRTVNEHLKNIYDSSELHQDPTIRIFRIVQDEGERRVERDVNFYNLDAIISVGYRVNSVQATAFRKWATVMLREYLIKGFVLDDERLAQGSHFGKDYFDELLERIREIRLSERRLHLKLTDIFALASDYDKTSELTKEFFAFIQNKLHYAITGKTAAELIHDRVNANKPHAGLTTWKQSPDGKVLRTDVTVAKNYLQKPELEQLQLAVSAFLDTAEARAKRGLPTTMAKWIGLMDGYLDLNEYPTLQRAGSISKKQADTKALQEFETFRVHQDREYVGDFEKEVERLEEDNKK